MKKRSLLLIILPLTLSLFLVVNITPVKGVIFWHKDLNTKGNWIEKIDGTWFKHYGRDGYILCGFDSQGHNDEVWQESFDRKSLPDYLKSYKVTGTGGESPLPSGTAGVYTMSASTSDPRALVDPDILTDPDVLSKRKDTQWFTTPFRSENALLTVEFNFKEDIQNKFLYASLYFLDSDQNRKLEVTMYDGNSTNPTLSVTIEPSEAQNGLYLVFTVYNPTHLTIRLFNGYNCNPCISGIFFDSIDFPAPPFVVPEIPLGTCSALVILLSPLLLRKISRKSPRSA